jgi:type II secretory pathway pseudopilin PulG
MAALLVSMSVMAIMLGIALPVWRTAVQREREAELIFRGEQYARAIALFSQRTGGFPPSLDVLEKGRFIRKLYKDPMTNGGNFQPVYLGQPLPGQPVLPGTPGRSTAQPASGPQPAQPARGGAGQQPRAGATTPIIGVVSQSTAASLRLYNGRGHYNEWAFLATEATQRPGIPGGTQTPGPGGRGRGPGMAPARPGFRGGPLAPRMSPPGRGGGPSGPPMPSRGRRGQPPF